jgi:hypothetical protein
MALTQKTINKCLTLVTVHQAKCPKPLLHSKMVK